MAQFCLLLSILQGFAHHAAFFADDPIGLEVAFSGNVTSATVREIDVSLSREIPYPLIVATR
jgi:hypothetical protein